MRAAGCEFNTYDIIGAFPTNFNLSPAFSDSICQFYKFRANISMNLRIVSIQTRLGRPADKTN